MASSRSPSLESLPGANSIGSFGEPTDYLSDSPLTISGSGTGSSPPVSDSAICDDFGGLTSSVESQGSLSNDSSCPRCTGCKSKQSDAVAKCITCNNYLCSNCVTAHQFMHCFDGHNVFRIATPSSALTSNTISPPLTTNSITANTNNLLSANDKLIMNGFDSHRLPLSINIKDEMNHTLMKSILNTITTPPPSSGGSATTNNTTTNNSNGVDNNIIISNVGLGGFSSALTNGNGGLGGGKTSSYFCVRHKNELLKFYCRTCGIPVCKDCIVIDHPSGLHECEHNSDNTPKQIENLLQLLNDVRNKANEMRSIIKNAEHNTTRIQVQYQKAQTEINETFLFYRSMLDERKIELLKELESFYSTKNMSQSVLLTKSQDHVDKVLQSCEFVERLTKNAGMNETIMLKKLMDNKMQSFMSYMQDLQSSYELDFVSNYQAIQVGVRNTFGYIRSNSELSSSVTKQPPIARPTGMNSMNNNNCMNGNGIIGQNNMMTTNGSSTSSSNGSLNMHHQNHGMVNGMNGGQNGHHNNSSMDRQLCGSNSNGMMVGGGGGNSMLSSSPPQNNMASAFETNIISKRFNGGSSLGPFVSDVNMQSMNPYEKWSNGESMFNNITDQYTIPMGNGGGGGGSGGNSLQNDTMLDLTSKLMSTSIFPPKSQIKRQKMIYHCKFGEFGVMEGQFTEPSGVAVNAQNDIIVADTNNHRIQIFDKEGRFKFQFGECGKRDGQLLYPNRVAVVRTSGDIIVTERSPTHQIQIYNQYGQFVRKFGANILQHPRGVTVDNKGRIIVVECKVMRVIIFDQQGNVLQKFGCSKHLEFPNGVVVNDKQEIFISDNRAHCVKVFNYEGVYLRQIGGEGITNYPIGVGINAAGEILIADNHNNFNLTIFTQEGQLVSALESKVKHAQCFDVALMDDGSVVLASKDYRLYIYRYVQVPPIGL
jgi:tripartite motif-containing protein 2/3